MDSVYQITSLIPKSKVLTYGKLAKLAKLKSPRQVGRLLHQNPDPDKIPCHRVVNYQGRPASNYAFGGAKAQSVKLKEEGIEFKKGRVNLAKHLWQVSGKVKKAIAKDI